MFRPLFLLLGATILALFSFPSPATPSVLPQAQSAAKVPEPPAGLSAEELTKRGDQLRAEKIFSGALEYYGAALANSPNSAPLHNRIGMVQIELGNWKVSIRELKLAIKLDPQFADAYNNLGVSYYETRKFGKAIGFYKKAIGLRGDASFYSNLGAAYFSTKDFEKAAAAYTKALELDPDVLDHNSRTGVTARIPSPDDRARFDYSMAKLYAKIGATDHSLIHLRRALEEGYKHINDVYKDEEFAALRKDPRFAQLMTERPTSLQD